MGASVGSACRCAEDGAATKEPVISSNLPEVTLDGSEEICRKASDAALTGERHPGESGQDGAGTSTGDAEFACERHPVGESANDGTFSSTPRTVGACSSASTADTMPREAEPEQQTGERQEHPKQGDNEQQMHTQVQGKQKRKQKQSKKKSSDQKQAQTHGQQDLPEKGAETDTEETGKSKPSPKKKSVEAKSKAKAKAKSSKSKEELEEQATKRLEEARRRSWIDEEIAKEKGLRQKAKKSGVKTGDGQVAWKDGKLVVAQDSSSSEDEEWQLSKMDEVEKAIYLERKRLGIKKAPKADCVTM